MTINDKSVALGSGANLADDYYNACTLEIEYDNEAQDNWECIRASGIIPSGAGHNGSSSHCYYCSLQDDETIDENSTDAQIKTSVIAHIDGLVWKERAVAKGIAEATKV